MAQITAKESPEMDALVEAFLALKDRGECYAFLRDLCTMKELRDMSQRLQAAKMLMRGNTYEQIVKEGGISTATISRINYCVQYGSGGYRTIIGRLEGAEGPAEK